MAGAIAVDTSNEDSKDSHSDWNNGVLSTLTLEDPSDGFNRPADNFGMYYLPNRSRNLGGGTAILVIKMEKIFSYYMCNSVSPVCHVHLFTYGRDNFHFGKPFFYVSDNGDNWISGSTYGFGVLGCSAFDSACVLDFEVTVVCLLPPDHHDQCG